MILCERWSKYPCIAVRAWSSGTARRTLVSTASSREDRLSSRRFIFRQIRRMRAESVSGAHRTSTRPVRKAAVKKTMLTMHHGTAQDAQLCESARASILVDSRIEPTDYSTGPSAACPGVAVRGSGMLCALLCAFCASTELD